MRGPRRVVWLVLAFSGLLSVAWCATKPKHHTPALIAPPVIREAQGLGAAPVPRP